MTTTLDPPADAPVKADAASPTTDPRPRGVPLWAPAALFAVVLVGGAVLAFAPQQNIVDSWGFSLFSARIQSSFLHAVNILARGPVTAGVTVLAALIIWRRDRLRALACLIGPGLAVGLAEVIKVMVGRRLYGSLCWPSGSAAVVAAMVTAFVLAVRGRFRWAALAVGSAAVILEVMALVAYRSHYLSDALGGALVGVGSVLLVDAVAHFRRRRPTTTGEIAAPVGRPHR